MVIVTSLLLNQRHLLTKIFPIFLPPKTGISFRRFHSTYVEPAGALFVKLSSPALSPNRAKFPSCDFTGGIMVKASTIKQNKKTIFQDLNVATLYNLNLLSNFNLQSSSIHHRNKFVSF